MATALRPPLSSRSSAGLRFFEGSSGPQGSATWFQTERLHDPDFAVDAYIADLRQYAPLEALSTELEKYLATLKSKVHIFVELQLHEAEASRPRFG